MKQHWSDAQRVLIQNDSRLKPLLKKVDYTQFKTRSSDLYPALVRAIAHQMVHGNAAKACLKRLCEKAGGDYSPRAMVPSSELVCLLSFKDIRACGFSENKTRAIVELTEHAVQGKLPTRAMLKKMSDAEIIKTLVPLRGVGRWTVEMYLIFSLNRPDVFPVDDFGVREGYRLWKGERKQRTPKYLRSVAKRWSPHGSLMARIFWQVADAHKRIKNS